MSQRGQRQSRGENTRPAPPSRTEHDSARSQSTSQHTSQSALPSIEPTDASSRTSASATQSPAQGNVFRVPQSPRAQRGEPNSKAAKIAIPRLKRNLDAANEASTQTGGRHRVNHACEPCRHRKTKCSGERPTCRHCQDFKISCYYADGKRDRVKKQFGSMTEKVADYEKLLRNLSLRATENDAKLIKASLEKETSYDAVADDPDDLTLDSPGPTETEEESGAESEASAGAGSTGALDRTDEDFTRDSARDTGFMGKNSEVTWMQRLRQQNKYDDEPSDADMKRSPNSRPPHSTNERPPDSVGNLVEEDDGFRIRDNSYHLDDMSVTTFETVDPYACPTADTAQHLFNCYMTRVHPSFPIVGRANLTAQFSKFVTGKVQRPPPKWLAIINMIFAISAKYSHLIHAEWKGDERDDLIYFTRARLLSINMETLFEHPDLQSIQILGLISFYFLSTSQINRSWTLNGAAIRWATSLGINMRNDSAALKDSLKEIRYRVWWSLYTMEHRLCGMTGRVNCILDDHCTAPLPAPIEEDQFETDYGERLLNKKRQEGDRAPGANNHVTGAVPGSASSTDRSRSGYKNSVTRSPSVAGQQPPLDWAKGVDCNSSLYFLHLVQLTRLTQNTFQQLYNPSTINGVWSDVQDMIGRLDEQLEYWYRTLPVAFDFKRKQRDKDYYEYRLGLGFVYYGTKMVIHRPCLCRLDRKISGQSSRSLEFNRNTAQACVEAAKDLLSQIPDEPNAVGLIRVGPWWSILHWLVQAATVLMLEISFRAAHMPEQAEALLEASKKAVRWLHALGEDNLSAGRAWALCNATLQETARKIGREATDLPTDPPGRQAPPLNSNYVPNGVPSSNHSQAMNMSGQQMMNPNMVGQSYPGYTLFNNFMHFDQYFPTDQHMADSMSGDMLDGMQYPPATEADTNHFISNDYHEQETQQGIRLWE